MNSNKPSMHLFIDTNVLLNFYAYSKDDLTELEKLVDILKTDSVRLYVTQQVVDEFNRNRDAKLSESFDKFRPLDSSCPRFMASLPGYRDYKKALKSFKNSRTTLEGQAREQANSRNLLADNLFARIVSQTCVIPADDDINAKAERRFRIGNPPGSKKSTIGDELNWELLLKHVPHGSDLHVISTDSDYASKLNATQPKFFLMDEWKRIKNGTLYLHEQISLFFKDNYPDQDFSLSIETQESIDALVKSSNFASTHAAIASLNSYLPLLSKDEVEEVVQGSLSNSQVTWIMNDSDVEGFFTTLLNKHGEALSETLTKRLKEALGLDTNNAVENIPEEISNVDDDDIPF